MLRSQGIWYSAVAFASFGLLSVIALDALRGQSHERILAHPTSPAPADAANGKAPKSHIASATEPDLAPATRSFGLQATQQTPPAPRELAVVPPLAVAVPTPEVRPIAPWAAATVTTTFTKLGRLSVAPPGEGGTRPQNCLALWDLATHMTKQEWKAACERSLRHP
jgi:hypothetical protein